MDIKYWNYDIKTAKEIAEETGLKEERILELTQMRLIPHYLIDRTTPIYSLRRTKDWIAANLTEYIEGEQLPLEITLISNGMYEIETDPANLPISIMDLAGLVYKVSPEGCPGIYFLCLDRRVVYVGQSKNIYKRVSDHQTKGRYVFDRAYALPVPVRLLNETEGAFIRVLRPPYNDGKYPVGSKEFTDEQIIDRYKK